MDKKSERTFGFLDNNVVLPRRSERLRIRVRPDSEGQENAAKRLKLSYDAITKKEVLPEEVEECEREVNVVPSKTRLFRRVRSNSDGQENAVKRLKLAENVVAEKEVLPDVVEECVREEVKVEPSNISRHRKEDEPYIVLNEQWMLTSEHLEIIFNTELGLEQRLQLGAQYCSDNCVINPVRRELLLEWLLQFQCVERLGSEVFHLAVTLMDAFLADNGMQEEQDGYRAAAAAFWLSYKFYHGRIEIKSILKHYKIRKKTLLKFERKILQSVNFNLQFTNSMSLLHYHMHNFFNDLIPRELYYSACYLLDLMFFHAEFIRESYHSRAITALFTTLQLFESPLKNKFLAEFDSTIKSLVSKLHGRLLNLLSKVRANEFFRQESALYKRYSSSKFCRICKHSALNRDFT